jgi:hypothetical protein
MPQHAWCATCSIQTASRKDLSIVIHTLRNTLPRFLALWATLGSAAADEGMWLFNQLPQQLLQEKYDFAVTPDWAEQVMLASVRFNNGGSASFVSSNGLVLTNQHVAAGTLHKLSSAKHRYAQEGFLAKTHAQELPAPDLELNQLVAIDEVTDQVHAVVTDDMDEHQALAARRAVMAKIEKQSLEETGLRSDVVTLYGGAQYHLYRYRKYTDVRLVWAPEASIGFYGGDADNFEFPRYNLDVTLFRVYEAGEPLQSEHFLRWSEHGAAENELVLVSGNPGSTQRIFTASALRYLRDHRLPHALNTLRRKEILFQQYGLLGPEQHRRATPLRLGIENNRKRTLGMLEGLQTPACIALKQQQETALLREVRADSELAETRLAWQKIAQVQRERAQHLQAWAELDCTLAQLATQLVLMSGEDLKPSGQRLREYRDSARASLEHKLFSPAPLYEDLEIARLTDALSHLVEARGGDDRLVVQVLAGKNPRQRASELVRATQLADVAVRKQLAAGGVAALEASTDPMIDLAQLLEPEVRRLRRLRDQHEEIERQAYAQINTAQVALHGTEGYPDATFTLRLAFGTVSGYQEEGQTVPPWTTMGQVYAHQAAHQARGDWRLPESWTKNQDQIDPQTPMNFVSTVDIIGGNSGSPVLNRAGELVGVIFDGNRQSLTAAYFYSEELSRAVAVHSSAIREALRHIYQAPQLADELGQ